MIVSESRVNHLSRLGYHESVSRKASYRVLCLFDTGNYVETIEKRGESMAALESSAELRRCTRPHSFQTFQGKTCYVAESQVQDTEGVSLKADDKKIKFVGLHPVHFLGNGFVV